jgi:hypothetical protein
MPKKIRVLKVPQQAFDPSRPPSSLLLSQVRQLQTAVAAAIDSEGEAALAIRTLTRLLEELRPQIVPRGHKDTMRPRPRRNASRATSGSLTRRRTARSRTAKKR